ncbi:MAG: hypothetical protein R3D03_14325 [Geminicoccaceae bacterium]
MSEKVKKILSWYRGENPGVKASLYRLLMQGKLAGTGKLVILPVDQGYEHGPARSFSKNPRPMTRTLSLRACHRCRPVGLCGAAGIARTGADTFAGQMPLILKVNSANSLHAGDGDPRRCTEFGEGCAPAGVPSA